MSTQFDEILERVLGKIPKKESQKAMWVQALKQKKFNLSGTMEFRSEDFMSDTTAGNIEVAAGLQVEEIMSGILNQDIFDEDTKETIRDTGNINVPAVYGLRDRTNTNISAINLVRIVNLTLHNYVEELMGTKGALKYQSGRLANSAQVSALNLSSKVDTGRVRGASVFFQYMLAPYAVFGKGGKRYTSSRDPVPLIRAAVMNAFKYALNTESFKSLDFNIRKKR